jgi:outer membrane protein assembly factor BamB
VANDLATKAHTFHAGDLYWKHKYPGTGVDGARKSTDDSRIFSSPAVVGNRVLFSADADGNRGLRGYLVSADLRTGDPQWVRELDIDKTGKVVNDGCGSVWASPTIIARLGIEVVSLADCHFADTPPYNERTLAVNIGDGTIRWVFETGRVDPQCDWDFGATANLGTDDRGNPTFLGVGGKDGTYYRIDPYTGKLVWKKNVVFGGLAGGFIATTAFDGDRVYGATALGDFGRFEGFGALGCQPGNPHDQLIQEPSMHAFDAKTGNVAWQGYLSQSFGPTTVAGGMTFVGTGIQRGIQIRDASNGLLVWIIPLPAPSDSGIVVTKNALVFGTGSSEQGMPDGVWAYTPLAGAFE